MFKSLPGSLKCKVHCRAIEVKLWQKVDLTLLKKTDSDVSAESIRSSSIQLGLAKLLLGKLRPVWVEPANPLRPWPPQHKVHVVLHMNQVY